MYGEDKTTLDELTKTITELEGLKIEIIEKTEKTSELNNAIEKMANQIKQADDKILNDTHFVATGNETATENEQNTTDGQSTNTENTTATQNEIAISKDSNVNILIDNINTLVNKVNEQVKAETERKAEEERKAKELEEKNQYVGTYTFGSSSLKITINENGELYFNGENHQCKVDITKKDNNGIITILELNGPASYSIRLYPVGTKLVEEHIEDWTTGKVTYKKTTSSKIRIVTQGDGIGCQAIYYKD